MFLSGPTKHFITDVTIVFVLRVRGVFDFLSAVSSQQVGG